MYVYICIYESSDLTGILARRIPKALSTYSVTFPNMDQSMAIGMGENHAKH